MNDLVNRFGVTLRSFREERGWSQEELALHANLNRSYLGEIERGQAIASLATIGKLALALDMHPSVLFERCEHVFRQEVREGDAAAI